MDFERARLLLDEYKLDEAGEELNTLETKQGATEDETVELAVLRLRLTRLQGNVKAAVQQADQMIHSDVKTISASALGETWLEMGIALRQQGQYDASIEALEHAFEHATNELNRAAQGAKTHRIDGHIFNVHLAMSKHYFNVGNKEKFVFHTSICMDLAEKDGNPLMQAEAYNQEGNRFFLNRDWEPAAEFMCRAIEHAEDLDIKLLIGKYKSNYAVILMSQCRLMGALECFETCLEIFTDLGDAEGVAGAHHNLAHVHTIKGELPLALKHYGHALVLDEKGGNKQYIGQTLGLMGSVYSAMNRLDEARTCYLRSLSLHEQIGIANDIGETLFFLVQLAIDTGDLNQAQQYAARIEDLSKSSPGGPMLPSLSKMAKALVLKNLPRGRQKYEAQAILQKMLDDGGLIHTQRRVVILNLCELLLEELRHYKQEEVLHEVSSLIGQLIEDAQAQSSFRQLSEGYRLLSKLALLEGDFAKARRLLNQSELIAVEKGFDSFALRVAEEQDELIAREEKWVKQPSIEALSVEMLEEAQIEPLIHQMVTHRPDQIPLPSAEEPILIMVLASDSGLPLFSKHFTKDPSVQDHLLAGVITALQTLGGEAFAESAPLERIKYGEHTILLRIDLPIVLCYVLKGPSFRGVRKLENFGDKLREEPEIWRWLTEDASVLDLDDSMVTRIADFADSIFVQNNRSEVDVSTDH